MNMKCTTRKLPDGKKISVPEVIDASGLYYFDDMEYTLWHTIQEYFKLFGIKTEDNEPDFATVKFVQDKLLEILMDSGVNFKFLTDEKQHALNEALRIEVELIVTEEDIDDIMVGALEGGINYWCRAAIVPEDKRVAEWGHEQIARGGELLIFVIEPFDDYDTKCYTLTREKIIKGIKQYIKNPISTNCIEQVDGKLTLDCCNADAGVCDEIIQYALFGDIVFA